MIILEFLATVGVGEFPEKHFSFAKHVVVSGVTHLLHVLGLDEHSHLPCYIWPVLVLAHLQCYICPPDDVVFAMLIVVFG